MSSKIKRLEQRLNQAKLELTREENENNRYLRKERTRRLIQKGALAEKYFDIEDLSVEETEQLFKMVSAFVKEKKKMLPKSEDET